MSEVGAPMSKMHERLQAVVVAKEAGERAKVEHAERPVPVSIERDAAERSTIEPTAPRKASGRFGGRPVGSRRSAVSYEESVRRQTFYLDVALIADLEAFVADTGANKSEIVRDAIRSAIKKGRKP